MGRDAGEPNAEGEQRAAGEQRVAGEPRVATDGGAAVFHCDLCGAVMLNLHCKLICQRCGYKRDCSDP